MRLRPAALLCLLVSGVLLTGATPVPINEPEALKYTQTRLESIGTLEITVTGFVYVKVSNDYIDKTLALLNRPDVQAPPYFSEGMVGAHITAITEKESQSRTLFLPQLEKPVVFAVTGLSTVDVENKRIYYLKVEIPQVELIRLFNGLPAKIQDHDFHITVGIEQI